MYWFVGRVQTYSQDVALSVCGWEPNLTMDKFNEHLVSFTDFCNDHSILDNPKLVARINDRFYSWKVAVPMLVSIMCFGRPLMQACVDQLCNTHMSSQVSICSHHVRKLEFYLY